MSHTHGLGAESWLTNWSHNCATRMAQRADFRTGGVAIAQSHISAITDGRCLFSVSAPRRFRQFGGAHARLGATAIQFLKWDSETECQTSTIRPPGCHVVLHVPLKGEFAASQGQRRVTVRSGQLLVVCSEGTAVRQWQGPCEVLNIVVPYQGLTRILASDFGIDVARPLELDPLAVVDLGTVATLTRMVETVIADLNEEGSFFRHPLLAQQAERTLLLLLLKSIPHRHLHLLDEPRSTVAPFYVRRAEAYMREHLADAVTIDTLAAACAVSARTLYYGFEKYRRLSPMKYLKGLRLASARRALIEGRASGRRVSEVAASFGYRNFSQFSRDYKQSFGESPAATLRGAEASPGRQSVFGIRDG